MKDCLAFPGSKAAQSRSRTTAAAHPAARERVFHGVGVRGLSQTCLFGIVTPKDFFR